MRRSLTFVALVGISGAVLNAGLCNALAQPAVELHANGAGVLNDWQHLLR